MVPKEKTVRLAFRLATLLRSLFMCTDTGQIHWYTTAGILDAQCTHSAPSALS